MFPVVAPPVSTHPQGFCDRQGGMRGSGVGVSVNQRGKAPGGFWVFVRRRFASFAPSVPDTWFSVSVEGAVLHG